MLLHTVNGCPQFFMVTLPLSLVLSLQLHQPLLQFPDGYHQLSSPLLTHPLL